jgi:hypothetical protein
MKIDVASKKCKVNVFERRRMMKNLLIVMLVLGLTSLASAVTVSLVDEGTIIDVAAGTTVRLNVVADGGLIGLDAIATVVGGDVVSAAPGVADAPGLGWDPGFSFDPLDVGTAAAEIGFGTFGASPVDPSIAGWFDIAYTGGTQVITLTGGQRHGGTTDSSFMPGVYSLGVVTIVPEPATIALLGLGALAFLRRRK